MAGCAERANGCSSTKGAALLRGVDFQSSLVDNANKWADAVWGHTGSCGTWTCGQEESLDKASLAEATDRDWWP